MPYILQNRRTLLRPHIDALVSQLQTIEKDGSREGDINYTISKLMQLMYPVAKYSEYNAAYGMLMCCAAEYYRTVIAPYEDKKVRDNGSV